MYSILLALGEETPPLYSLCFFKISSFSCSEWGTILLSSHKCLISDTPALFILLRILSDFKSKESFDISSSDTAFPIKTRQIKSRINAEIGLRPIVRFSADITSWRIRLKVSTVNVELSCSGVRVIDFVFSDFLKILITGVKVSFDFESDHGDGGAWTATWNYGSFSERFFSEKGVILWED